MLERKPTRKEMPSIPQNDLILYYQKTKDKDVANFLLEKNKGLVGMVLKSFGNKKFFANDDLFQEGMIGLLRAFETYDPQQGKLSTYARAWIWQHIQKFHEADRLIKLPDQYTSTKKLNPERREHLSNVSSLNCSQSVRYFGDSCKRYIPMVDLVSTEGYEGRKVRTPEQMFEDKCAIHNFHVACEGLDERSRTILNMRGGMNGYDESILTEVSKKVRVTRERVRQIEKNIFDYIQYRYRYFGISP